jgi:hypothetical protein
MSPSRFASAFLFVFVSSLVATAQTASTAPQASAQRDPQAVSILTQALAASGGQSVVAGIQDFTASGNITYNWDSVAQGTVTVKGRGLHEFRIDATLSDGLHSSVTNLTASFQKNPDGSISPLPSQNLVKPAIATCPLFQVLAALQDTSINLTYGGLVSHNGQQVYDVLEQKSFSATGDPGSALSSISKAHIFIDPNALTVVSILDTAYRRDGEAGGFPHETQFSAYQSINGILVPFSVIDLIAGQQTMSIQLTQVTFNTGLTDSVFE